MYAFEVARVGVRLGGWCITFAVALWSVATGAEGRLGVGRSATPQEIQAWDIDVRPDGTGLPVGRGGVRQGEVLYEAHCSSCHGVFGEENRYHEIAGGRGTLATEEPLRTVGSFWPYATTVFDYINRAMPFMAPKQFSADEVYALTAYVLHLNDILGIDGVLDQSSLPQVQMPNKDGFLRGEHLPDVHNRACMRHCEPGS